MYSRARSTSQQRPSAFNTAAQAAGRRRRRSPPLGARLCDRVCFPRDAAKLQQHTGERGRLTAMGTSDETEDTEGPAASAEPFMRSDDAAGSAYELTKLTVLGLTLAPLRLILWVATVLPMYAACRLICEYPRRISRPRL